MTTTIDKNKIPEHVQRIHLIAVCGTGMGALACLLKDLGYTVTGSDQHVYPPMSIFLKEKGIFLSQGFQPENLAYGPDLVVVGNAVSKDNPEVVEMCRMGSHFCSMPQAVNAFAGKGKQTILVTGTHGKTTTSSLIAWLLHCAGMGVSFVIGGILANFNSNYFLGTGDYLVVEGDEYDTAFFDKGPKFMHYDPTIAVLTGVEFDHADIFTDLDHIKKAFSTFVAGLRSDATLVAFQPDSNVDDVIQAAPCNLYRYGNQGGDWAIKPVRIDPPWTFFDVTHTHDLYGRFQTSMLGEHNLSNTLAAIAVADRLNIPKQTIQEALQRFKGVKRRQEYGGLKTGSSSSTILPTTPRPSKKPFKPLGVITVKIVSWPCSNPGPTPACATFFRTCIQKPLTARIRYVSADPHCWKRYLLKNVFHHYSSWTISINADWMRTTSKIQRRLSIFW